MIENKPKPEILDTLMTAVLLAAEELSKIYPQPHGDSVEMLKSYLLQKALKKQEDMTVQERERFFCFCAIEIVVVSITPFVSYTWATHYFRFEIFVVVV